MLKKAMHMQTGFDHKYQQRREHARATWFPSNEQEMQRSAPIICTRSFSQGVQAYVRRVKAIW